MDVAVSRSHVAEDGTWLRDPIRLFILTTTVRFSNEERWAVDVYNLYHHVVFNRTPPWYFTALREAEREKERAARDGLPYDWPWYVPPAVPPEWIVTVGRLVECSAFDVVFKTASELDQFEPRMMAAFAQFKRFLSSYSARPQTTVWRL